MKLQNVPELLFPAVTSPQNIETRSLSLITKTCQFGYLVTYVDGAREHYLLTYEGRVEAVKSTGPVTPQSKEAVSNPGDTASANSFWRYRGYITRHLTMLNRAGEHFESTGVGRCIEISDSCSNETAAWAIWREHRCNARPQTPEFDFEPAITPLNANFDRFVVMDKNRMSNYFRHCTGGITAVSEMD